MKITISFDKNDGADSKKSSLHKPWFWLLIILAVSVAIRLYSKGQPKVPIETGGDGDSSSAFDLVTKSENTSSVSKDEDYSEASYDEEEFDEKEPEQNQEKSKSIFHFILNINTKKYHTKECSAAQKLTEEKRQDTDIEAESLEEAERIIESRGYDLCGLCGR